MTKKGTKCYVYLDKIKGNTMDQILASYSATNRSSLGIVYATATTKTVFTASDGLGTSKYFAGAPTDNYVKFGGFYWRIIRMNGDKTTRLIYAGKASVIDALSNKQAVLANGYYDGSHYMRTSTSAFNYSTRDNAYVGFKYATGSLRGTSNKSTILSTLDTWYESNLKTSYGKYIDGSTGFCGDRTPYTDYKGTTIGGGTGKTTTLYGAQIRLYKNYSSNSAAPVLTCPHSSDLYTTSGSGKGNQSLDNPIGLISADEAAYAGGLWDKENENYYLYSGMDYWTMSPSIFEDSSGGPYIFLVRSNGSLNYNSTSNSSYDVRPVINLKADTHFYGNGTWNSPFEVVVED